MPPGMQAARRSQAILRSGFRTYLELADGLEPRADQPHPILPEEGDESDESAHVEGHIEAEAAENGIVPAEEPGHDDEVGRAGDGDEFGEPLD